MEGIYKSRNKMHRLSIHVCSKMHDLTSQMFIRVYSDNSQPKTVICVVIMSLFMKSISMTLHARDSYSRTHCVAIADDADVVADINSIFCLITQQTP